MEHCLSKWNSKRNVNETRGKKSKKICFSQRIVSVHAAFSPECVIRHLRTERLAYIFSSKSRVFWSLWVECVTINYNLSVRDQGGRFSWLSRMFHKICSKIREGFFASFGAFQSKICYYKMQPQCLRSRWSFCMYVKNVPQKFEQDQRRWWWVVVYI